SVEALLFVVEGEHPEADRLAREDRDLRETGAGGIRHEFEVRCSAADDHAECDDRIGAGVEGGLPRNRKFEAARNAQKTEGCSALLERAGRPGDEAVADLLVPVPGENHNVESGAVDVEVGGAFTAHDVVLLSWPEAVSAVGVYS